MAVGPSLDAWVRVGIYLVFTCTAKKGSLWTVTHKTAHALTKKCAPTCPTPSRTAGTIDTARYRTLPHDTARYRTIPHDTARSIPHDTARYRTIDTARYRTIPQNRYRTIPHVTARYRTIPHDRDRTNDTARYHTIPHDTARYRTIPHERYRTIPHDAARYQTIPHRSPRRRDRTFSGLFRPCRPAWCWPCSQFSPPPPSAVGTSRTACTSTRDCPGYVPGCVPGSVVRCKRKFVV